MQEYSQRLQSRLTNLNYKESSEEMNAFLATNHPDLFHKEIFTKDNEKINIFGIVDKNIVPAEIVALKYSSDCTGSLLAYLDVAADFLHGKNEMSLETFSFREVENYLRDRNDVPSSENAGTSAFPIIEKLKNALKESMGDGIEKNEGEKKSPTIKDDYDLEGPKLLPDDEFKSFDEIPLSEKSYFVNKVISEKISPLLRRDNGDVRCVFTDDLLCVLEYTGACAACLYSLSSTMNFIQKVLRLELACPNLLVMTDS